MTERESYTTELNERERERKRERERERAGEREKEREGERDIYDRAVCVYKHSVS